MRPRRLRLTGFGAFPDTEEVDFDELARLGLFVVTGPTGAGKTTLFDAMAFALYGGLPAGRPSSQVRSHHSAPGDACRVELTFSVEGRTHVVRRTPELVRPKRRGPGTTVEPATAELHVVDADGTERPVASGTRQVTDACVALVGLDAGQFERVVLLPQGRFQQFLLADTKDRRPLLQQLFGTALYRRAVEELKRRAVELAGRVERVDAEIDHHRRNAKEHLRWVAAGLHDDELDGVEPDDAVELLAAFWQKLAPGVAEVERLSRELTGQAAEAARAADAARVLAGRWDQRQSLRSRAEALTAAEPEIARARELAAAARRAAPVVAQAVVVERAVARLAAADEAATVAAGALSSELVAAGLVGPGEAVDPDTADRALGVAVDGLERAAAAVARLAEVRTAHDRAVAGLAGVDERAAELVAEQTRTDERRAELATRAEALEPVAAGGPELSVRVTAAADLLDRRRLLDARRAEVEHRQAAHADVESRLATVLADFVAGAAPRLAAALRPGSPCPVCGSTEHPAPAAADEGAEVDVRTLERTRQAAARAAAELAAATTAVAEQLRVLGDDAERRVDDLEEAHRLVVAELEAATAAARELARVRTRIDEGTAHHEGLQRRATTLATERATAVAAVAAAAERVAELEAEVGETDAEELVERGHRLAAAGRAVQACRRATAATVTAAGAVEQGEEALALVLSESGFGALDAARAAGLPEPELHRLERGVADHEAASGQVQGGLAALADVELPDERPDAEALAAVSAELVEADSRERARVERLLERGAQAQKAISAATSVEDANAGLRDLRERTERVAAISDGQGPGKIGLETWVLAGELERVTEAANVHLARMTNGRYQLQRTDDAGHRAKQAGLDLTVFDSHTGRTRPPTTLSGGEQFQASLALALGLADVVSLGGVGSGRRFEALFVDEGFGSLDPDALDQAVDALHHIHASGRMVGVITHVEAMKQQLPTGVEVVPRRDGRGSSLTPAGT